MNTPDDDEPKDYKSTILAGIAIHEDEHDDMETELVALAANQIIAVTWKVFRKKSAQDKTIQSLSHIIVSKDILPVDVQLF